MPQKTIHVAFLKIPERLVIILSCVNLLRRNVNLLPFLHTVNNNVRKLQNMSKIICQTRDQHDIFSPAQCAVRMHLVVASNRVDDLMASTCWHCANKELFVTFTFLTFCKYVGLFITFTIIPHRL